MRRRGGWAAVMALAWAMGTLQAHPEFQAFVQKNSGRYVDCALCHTHPDGPDGPKPGQMGSLSPAELQQLNEARSVFEPGIRVDHPLLNDFGDHILQAIGKRQFLLLRTHPERLAEMLGDSSDLDGDGISDAAEYLAGTHPLNRYHGDPWRLFVFNLGRYRFELFMLGLATLFGIYGLSRLLQWFEQEAVAGGSGGLGLPARAAERPATERESRTGRVHG